MNVCDIEAWCRAGNGGAIGRTLLLPLSSPRTWKPGALPPALARQRPLPGYPLRAVDKVQALLGLPIAVGFALLAQHPDEPFVHAFNVQDGQAVDLALADHEPVAYWGYLPSPGQLSIDRLSIPVESPTASVFVRLRRAGPSPATTCP